LTGEGIFEDEAFECDIDGLGIRFAGETIVVKERFSIAWIQGV
jgi:hypothetical protein